MEQTTKPPVGRWWTAGSGSRHGLKARDKPQGFWVFGQLTSSHGEAVRLRPKFAEAAHFLGSLEDAPQLTLLERWCRILGRALSKFIHGRVPRPPPGLLPTRNWAAIHNLAAKTDAKTDGEW